MSETDHYKLMLHQLNLLRELAGKGATENMDAIPPEIDWKTLADELEPRVFGTYGQAVYRHARKILRRLAKSRRNCHDYVELGLSLDLLQGALEDSPSLITDADNQILAAVEAERLRRERKDKRPDAIPTVTSLSQLITLTENALVDIKALDNNGRE